MSQLHEPRTKAEVYRLCYSQEFIYLEEEEEEE